MSSPGFRGMVRVWLIVATVCSIETSVKAEDLCREPEKKDRRVVIDGNTGMILSGSDFYPRGTSLEIVIHKNNPFKYAYNYSANVARINGSGAISAFLGLLSPVSGVSGLWTSSDDTEAKDDVTSSGDRLSQALPGGVPDKCTGTEDALLNSLGSKLSAASSKATGLAGQIKKNSSEYNKIQANYNKFINLTASDNPGCDEMIKQAKSIYPKLSKPDIGMTSKDVSALSKEVEGLLAALGNIDLQQPACKVKRERLESVGQRLKLEASKMAVAVETIEKGKESFKKLAELIHTVVSTDGFKEKHGVGGSRKPSVVTVTVKRTSLRDKDAEPKTVKTEIQIGHPRFALGVGLGVSWIPEQGYEQVDSLVPDGMGGQMAGKRFELVDESDPTPLGAVLLHANVGRWSKKHDIPLALSVGVSIGDDDEAARYGYLFGLSGGFLDRMFYVTAAYHLREVDRLGGGFDDGDVVPSGISGVPIREETESDVMVAFTYNVLEPKGK